MLNDNHKTYKDKTKFASPLLRLVVQSLLAHPLQPQLLHSMILPSSSWSFGTRQMQPEPNCLSTFWMQLRQQSFSKPYFFHLAIRFASAYFSANRKS